MLLVSSDPRDLISSPLFEAQESVDLHGLVLNDLDAENNTGGEPVEGVQVELLRLSDDFSEARTQTGSDGRFTLTDLPREEMLLRVTHAGNVTIERTLVPGEFPEVTLTLSVGEGVDERDLRTESGLASAVQLSTAIAFLSLIAAGLGFAGASEARRGLRYRRTQWLCGLAGGWAGDCDCDCESELTAHLRLYFLSRILRGMRGWSAYYLFDTEDHLEG